MIDIHGVLLALLQLTGIVAGILIPYFLKQNGLLAKDASARDGVMAIAMDGAHYAQAYAAAEITRVGPINVGNPEVAAAANYILRSATDEIAHLQLSPDQVIDLARAALAKVKAIQFPILHVNPPGAGQVIADLIHSSKV